MTNIRGFIVVMHQDDNLQILKIQQKSMKRKDHSTDE